MVCFVRRVGGAAHRSTLSAARENQRKIAVRALASAACAAAAAAFRRENRPQRGKSPAGGRTGRCHTGGTCRCAARAGGQNTGTVCARSAGADARTAGAAPGIHACAGGNGQRRTGKICAEARRFRAEDSHICMGLRRGSAGLMVPVLQPPVRTAAAGGRSARDRAEGGPSGCPADANRAVAVPVRAFPARDLRDNGLRAGRAAAAPLRGARIYALSPPRPHLGRPARRVPRAALVQPAGVVGGGAFPHRRGALLRRGYRPPSRRERTCGLWPLTHPHDVPRAGRSPQRGNDNVGARRAAQNAHHFHHKAPENRNSRSDPRASALRRGSRLHHDRREGCRASAADIGKNRGHARGIRSAGGHTRGTGSGGGIHHHTGHGHAQCPGTIRKRNHCGRFVYDRSAGDRRA